MTHADHGRDPLRRIRTRRSVMPPPPQVRSRNHLDAACHTAVPAAALHAVSRCRAATPNMKHHIETRMPRPAPRSTREGTRTPSSRPLWRWRGREEEEEGPGRIN